MWIKDPKTGQKSVTLSMLFITFIVVIGKYVFEGVEIWSYTVPRFDSSIAWAFLSPMAALYFGRKSTDAGSPSTNSG